MSEQRGRLSATPLAAAQTSRLEADARHHRDRLALYRARILTSSSASPNHLRALQRRSRSADARLRAAAPR